MFVSLAQTSFLRFRPCSPCLTAISKFTHPKPTLYLFSTLFPIPFQQMALSPTQGSSPSPPPPFHMQFLRPPLSIPPQVYILSTGHLHLPPAQLQTHQRPPLTGSLQEAPSWASCFQILKKKSHSKDAISLSQGLKAFRCTKEETQNF